MGVLGIGTNKKRIDSDIKRGITYPITSMAWYSPSRPPRPMLFKFKGEDCILKTTTDLKINYTDYKCYDGEHVKNYKCDAVIGGI
ncbi:hypothetical protein K413DRAFT_2662 [Clostridium sp. ASBs410]|nr:hypothetical protein K413DRAFT_2662 [Clostridium sp. ASBs410]